jgi:hypothetical protein
MPTSDLTIVPNIFAGLLVSAAPLAFLIRTTANYIRESREFAEKKREWETESPHIPSPARRAPHSARTHANTLA